MSQTREEMRLNRRVVAMAAVVEIAFRQGDSSKPVDGALVALKLTDNRRGLESIFKQLIAAKILIGFRGARGGYALARPAGEITLADIDKAIDPSEIEAPPELAAPIGIATQSYRRVLGQWSIAAVIAREPATAGPTVNPHFGSSLEDFLEAEGLLEEATEHAINAVVAYCSETEPD